MISRKNLWNLCDKYIREVITGPLGSMDLKHKGSFHWVNEFPMQQYEPMVDPPKPISMTFSVGRIEIETRHYNGSWMYETRVRFTWMNHVYVAAFEIPQEAWSRQALEYHFKEFCRNFEKDTGLIKLTPEEEYQKEWHEAKKAAMAKAYGVTDPSVVGVASGKFDMEILKKEIESLKNKSPQKHVVQGPNGNMYVASPDMGQQVLNNIYQMMNVAEANKEIQGIASFNGMKHLAKLFYQEHGKFPEAEDFQGMNVVYDPGVPEGTIVFVDQKMHGTFEVTGPPMHVIGGQKYGKNPVPAKKNVQGYSNAGQELANVVPALRHKGIHCPECTDYPYNNPLSELIIHLNDFHKWPRSGTDPNPHNKPNIADWIDEVCLINGLDQSFHPKGEKKPSPRDWAKLKKQQTVSKEAAAEAIEEMNNQFPGMPPGWPNWIPKGMFDGA